MCKANQLPETTDNLVIGLYDRELHSLTKHILLHHAALGLYLVVRHHNRLLLHHIFETKPDAQT